MPVLFSNNASAPLAASITTSTTSITVTTGQGALFPAVAAGSYFYATLVDSSNNLEIVKVTARSGDTMTVARAQEGTVARAYAAADKLELRITAAGLGNLLQLDGTQTVSGNKTFSGANTFSGSIALSGGGSLAGTFSGTATFSGAITFSNTVTANISGNAGTVTDGVYLSTAQTISGAKTFSGQVAFTGATVPQFNAIATGIQGRVLVGNRELRMMTADSSLKVVNAANNAFTHTFSDNGDFTAAGKVAGVSFNTASWTVEESGGALLFKYGGVAVAKIASSGQITSTDDVTAFGTV